MSDRTTKQTGIIEYMMLCVKRKVKYTLNAIYNNLTFENIAFAILCAAFMYGVLKRLSDDTPRYSSWNQLQYIQNTNNTNIQHLYYELEECLAYGLVYMYYVMINPISILIPVVHPVRTFEEVKRVIYGTINRTLNY